MIFEDVVLKQHATGSRYICNPPPTDTDNDTIFLVNGYYDWKKILVDDGWTVDDGAYPHQDMKFCSFRKGEENYIITELDWFYDSFVIATQLARNLNAQDKAVRISLFEQVEGAFRHLRHGEEALPGGAGLPDIELEEFDFRDEPLFVPEPEPEPELIRRPAFVVRGMNERAKVITAAQIAVIDVHPEDHVIMRARGFDFDPLVNMWIRD